MITRIIHSQNLYLDYNNLMCFTYNLQYSAFFPIKKTRILLVI